MGGDHQNGRHSKRVTQGIALYAAILKNAECILH